MYKISDSNHPTKITLKAIFICGLAAIFYIYDFLLRVTPSVMTNQLMSYFDISASGLGILTAFFFYGYTPMQLPAGMLYDYFGPRKLLITNMFLCACSAILFSFTQSYIIAILARIIMGATGAFAFVGALLVAANWIPLRHFPLYTGIVQFFGCLGAIFGQQQVANISNHIGWKHTMLYIGLCGYFFALLFWLFLHDQPTLSISSDEDLSNSNGTVKTKKTKKIRKKESLLDFQDIMKMPQTWAVGAYSLCCWAPISMFAALWGIPYIMTLYHVNNNIASDYIMWIWIGIAIASPLIGWVSDLIERRVILLKVCSLAALLASIYVLFTHGHHNNIMYLMLFIFGAAASSQAICFGLVQDNNKHAQLGTAMGLNNMCVIAGSIILQPLAGFILEYLWSGKTAHHVHIYSLHAYHYALIALPLINIVGLFIACFAIKETYGKKTEIHQN